MPLRCSTVVFLLQAIAAVFAKSDGCKYRLIEQPPNMMTCNPYPSGRLATRCALEFTSSSDGGPLRFDWYVRTELGGDPQPLSDAGFNSSMITRFKAESVLTIPLQNGTSSESACENFRGYFCRVSFHNGTILLDSQAVYLFPRYAISSTLKNCEKQDVQLSRTSTCVDLEVLKTEPTNPPSSPTTASRAPSTILPATTISIPGETAAKTTKFPTATTSSKSPAVTVSDPVVLQTSNFYKTSPPTTPSRSTPPVTSTSPSQVAHVTGNPPHTSDLDPQTTTSVPESPHLPHTTSKDTPLLSKNPSANEANPSAGDDSSPPLNLDDVLLYLAIGVVILLIVIVIGLVLCLCLCNKLCHKSKYCTCYL